MKKRFFIPVILFSLIFAGFAEENILNESVDSQNRLRLMTYEDEYFISEAKNENTVLINKAGQTASRSYYDDLSRIIKNETWNISDARKSKIVLVEVFEYDGSSDFVSKKTSVTDTSEEVTVYASNGLPRKTELFYFKDGETNAEGETEKIKYLFSQQNIIYDEEDRVVSEEVKGENFSGLKKYIYNEDSDIPPDFENYENGKLIKRIQYSGKSDYSEEIFFDSSYYVKSYFEEGTRKRDEYFQNGKLLRSKIYE